MADPDIKKIIDTNSFMEDFDDQRFIPTHPMAGKAVSGWDEAEAELFKNAVWAITKEDRQVIRLINDLEARPITISIEAHDQAVGRYSHLVQLIVSVLAANDFQNARDEAVLSGPAYKDVTRIAASSPDFWQAIFKHNKNNILEPLQQLIDSLIEARDALENEDYQTISKKMKTGQKGRKNVIKKDGISSKDYF